MLIKQNSVKRVAVWWCETPATCFFLVLWSLKIKRHRVFFAVNKVSLFFYFPWLLHCHIKEWKMALWLVDWMLRPRLMYQLIKPLCSSLELCGLFCPQIVYCKRFTSKSGSDHALNEIEHFRPYASSLKYSPRTGTLWFYWNKSSSPPDWKEVSAKCLPVPVCGRVSDNGCHFEYKSRGRLLLLGLEALQERVTYLLAS